MHSPCVPTHRFGRQGRATPGRRKASVALRPSFPQSDRLGGPVTAHNIYSPGGLLSVTRRTIERRLPRSSSEVCTLRFPRFGFGLGFCRTSWLACRIEIAFLHVGAAEVARIVAEQSSLLAVALAAAFLRGHALRSWKILRFAQFVVGGSGFRHRFHTGDVGEHRVKFLFVLLERWQRQTASCALRGGGVVTCSLLPVNTCIAYHSASGTTTNGSVSNATSLGLVRRLLVCRLALL